MTPPCPRQCSRAFSCVTAPDDSHSWIIHLRLSLFCAQDSLCLLGQQLGAPRHTSLPLIQVMAFGLGAGVSRHSQPGGRYPVAVGPRRSSESGTIPPALTAPPPHPISASFSELKANPTPTPGCCGLRCVCVWEGWGEQGFPWFCL